MLISIILSIHDHIRKRLYFISRNLFARAVSCLMITWLLIDHSIITGFWQKKSRKTRHSLFSKVNPMSKNLLVLGDEEKKRKFERFLIMNHFLFVFWVKDRTRKKPFLPSFCWIWSFIFIYKMSWCQLVVLLTWFDKSCPFQYLSVAFKYFRCFPDKLFYSNLSPCWASFKPVLFGIGWWMIHDQAPHIIFAPRFVRTIK